MKQIIRVEVKNWKEEELLRKAFKSLPIRVVKGFGSLIISPKSEDIRASKESNKYLQLLSVLSILEKTGFRNSVRLIKF